MNKPNLSNLVDASKLFITRRSPEILTGIGIAGMVTTTVLAVKATPKALVLIGQAENEMERDLKPIEAVKVAWKPYIPAIVTGTMSTMCLIGASSVNRRRNAALATAYKLSETEYGNYLGWSAGQLMEMYLNPCIKFGHSKFIFNDGLECTIITLESDPTHDFAEY